ncbi:MAG TPA: hypothetical protein VI197_30495 [Polyangiaceae bacterium]
MLADTERDAEIVQREVQRRLGPGERFRTACQMSQTMREMAVMRIRSKHPELDEQGILDQLMWELYGFRRVTE